MQERGLPATADTALRLTRARPALPVSGHVFRVERKRGPVWYAKYRLPDGRQVQRKLGPAWTGRGRPAGGLPDKAPRPGAARRHARPGSQGHAPRPRQDRNHGSGGGGRVPALHRARPRTQALDREGLPLADQRPDPARARRAPHRGRHDRAGRGVAGLAWWAREQPPKDRGAAARDLQTRSQAPRAADQPGRGRREAEPASRRGDRGAEPRGGLGAGAPRGIGAGRRDLPHRSLHRLADG